MTNQRFLQSVARHILSTYNNFNDLTLVFPNKRSALFLKKYIEDNISAQSGRPQFMPHFMTMGTFMANFSDTEEMDVNEQIFLLYDCYRDVLRDLNREDQLRDFDRFIFWGMMILDDFDDVDRQLANAAMLFKNLKDLKQLNADYLDDEQKELVRQMFGESPRDEIVTEFWTHVRYDDGKPTSPESSFIALWQVLGQLYTAFHNRLKLLGLNTAGHQYRDAASKVSDMSIDDFGAKKYAFVGFNDLTKSEFVVLKRLKDIGVASFYWDFDDSFFKGGVDSRLKSLFDRLKHTFALPEDFEPAPVLSEQDIEVIAVPSNVAQAKSVTDILDKWYASGYIDRRNPIDTAIVLPDQKLLTPILYSIPASIDSVNITMGINAAMTPFATMLRSVVAMQLKARAIHSQIHYYYADVVEVLSHPHIQLFAAKEAEKIKKHISRNNLFNINADDICKEYPEIAFIFSPVKSLSNAYEMCNYTKQLIEGLSAALSAVADKSHSPLPELELLDFFAHNLEKLETYIERYNIEMSDDTFFALIERYIRALRIDLKGTPLRGLQIMGILETRVLDFDNLIVLSMNENTFPRSSHMRTMIPNALRRGYGMTTIDHQDSLYTYYFYHMLARARHVKLIYDSRTESFGAGEPSRYISQLNYLSDGRKVKFSTLQFKSDFNSPPPIIVAKDEKVMRYLDRFKPGGNGFLSASALKEYKQCRLRFYLRYVRNLRADSDISDFIDASTYGTIVHNVAENLYTKYKDKPIDTNTFDAMIGDRQTIEQLMLDAVAKHYYHKQQATSIDQLPAEGQLVCTIATHYLTRMLNIERNTYKMMPFHFIEGEKEVRDPAWKLTPSLTVNFKMSIDRVDSIAPDYLRFIDYKTGGDKVDPTTIDRIFTRERHDDSAIFQLLTYCVAYADMVDSNCSIQPVVYPLRLMMANDKIPQIVIDGITITDYKQVESAFRHRLEALIGEIFDPNIPFDQAEKNDSCRFCPFLDLCGRTVPQFD